MNKNKLLYYGSIFTIAIAFLALFQVAFWLLYPYKILTFGPENGKILQKTVYAGQYIRLQQDYCKYQDITSVIDRQFIDSIIYQVPTVRAKRPLGCHKLVEYIYVPYALGPGKYHIYTTITFDVNPLRKITLTVRTDEFTVLKSN